MTVFPPIKLTVADREKYGGPEWLDTDAAVRWLLDIPLPDQIAIERQMRAVSGVNLLTWLAREQPELSVENLVLRAWFALRRDGVEVELKDFTPDWVEMDYAKSSPDADPPSDGADSTPSPDETPTEPSPTPSRTSSRRTAASTRGSGKRTR